VALLAGVIFGRVLGDGPGGDTRCGVSVWRALCQFGRNELLCRPLTSALGRLDGGDRVSGKRSASKMSALAWFVSGSVAWAR
jgi:hypothetical protein